jgi:hypothetical protein
MPETTMREKSVMPRRGTIRDERGYTERERGQAEDDPIHFMDSNVRKKLFPGAF